MRATVVGSTRAIRAVRVARWRATTAAPSGSASVARAATNRVPAADAGAPPELAGQHRERQRGVGLAEQLARAEVPDEHAVEQPRQPLDRGRVGAQGGPGAQAGPRRRGRRGVGVEPAGAGRVGVHHDRTAVAGGWRDALGPGVRPVEGGRLLRHPDSILSRARSRFFWYGRYECVRCDTLAGATAAPSGPPETVPPRPTRRVRHRSRLGRTMRTLRIVTASTLLAGAAVVVPVVSVGATPHAVKPSLQRVPDAGRARRGLGRGAGRDRGAAGRPPPRCPARIRERR